MSCMQYVACMHVHTYIDVTEKSTIQVLSFNDLGCMHDPSSTEPSKLPFPPSLPHWTKTNYVVLTKT